MQIAAVQVFGQGQGGGIGFFFLPYQRGDSYPQAEQTKMVFGLGIAQASYALFGYTFGYELLLLNGAITFAALWAFSFMRKPSAAI